MRRPAPRCDSREERSYRTGAAGLAEEEEEEEAVSPSSPATLPLSPGPGLFRCTYVLVDGITGTRSSREQRRGMEGS
jgi:hypothetical protein